MTNKIKILTNIFFGAISIIFISCEDTPTVPLPKADMNLEISGAMNFNFDTNINPISPTPWSYYKLNFVQWAGRATFNNDIYTLLIVVYYPISNDTVPELLKYTFKKDIIRDTINFPNNYSVLYFYKGSIPDTNSVKDYYTSCSGTFEIIEISGRGQHIVANVSCFATDKNNDTLKIVGTLGKKYSY